MTSTLRPLALAWFALTLCLHAAPVFETVAEFETPPATPFGSLVLAGDGNYYGTASDGGSHGFGTVFRLTPGGVRTNVVQFTGTAGTAPGSTPLAGLTLAADGSLYGTTSTGGSDDFGTVFKVTTAGTLTTLVQFTGTAGTAKGSAPAGELLLHSDGNFYGTTSGGGAGDLGTIFKMTPAGTFTTLAQFTGTSGAVQGSGPESRLTANAAGVLYGVTPLGGAGNFGTAFKITTAGNFTSLVQFTGTGGNTRGTGPVGPLALGTDSNFYGVTETGGINNLGTFFRLTQAGGHARLYDFDGSVGSQPGNGLFTASNGLFYGATFAGGAAGSGLIFSFSTAGVIGQVAEFTGVDGAAKGSECRGTLTAGADGALYGTTLSGGAGNNGTAFKVTTAGFFTHLTEFTSASGWNPSEGLATGPDGALYVGNTAGGTSGYGSIVKVSTAGVVSPIVSFTGIAGTARGEEPAGVLTTGLDGALYGVTRLGGASNAGTAFKITTAGVFTSLSAFGTTIGARPAAGFAMDSSGNFYGTGSSGGLGGFGSVFGMTPLGTRGRLASFTGTAGASPGGAPLGGLALANNGSLYGTTSNGGSSNLGTFFRLDSSNQYQVLAHFTGANGSTPVAGPALGPDGNLYGTTSGGGTGGLGTLFRITPAGILTTLHSFAGTDGSAPHGALLVAPDGTLYGSTTAGGTNGFGTVFRRSTAGVVEVLFHFTGAEGGAPGDLSQGALAFGPEGNLYGTTSAGGSLNGGNVFRLRQLGPHVGTLGSLPQSTASMQVFARVVSAGETTGITWQYGTTPALGSTLTASDVTPSGPKTVAAVLTGLAPQTTYYFRAVATNPSGTSTGSIESFTTPTPFGLWKFQHLGSTNAPDLGDTDGDTLPDLTEYALGLDPLVSSPPPAPQLVNGGDGDRLALTFERDPSKNDVTLEVQAAGDLNGPWTPIATSTLGAPFSGPAVVMGDDSSPGVKTVEVRDVATIASEPHRFLRLRITH